MNELVSWAVLMSSWLGFGVLIFDSYKRWHIDNYKEPPAPISFLIFVVFWPILVVAYAVNLLGGKKRE